jgi:anti-anti-sigma factor
MSALELHARQERGCWVVRLQDDVDHATVPYWKGILDLLPRNARVVVDLDAVRYVDSAGIALLLWLRRRATNGSGQLALARGPHFLERIFRVAGIPALIPSYLDPGAAVEALAGSLPAEPAAARREAGRPGALGSLT